MNTVVDQIQHMIQFNVRNQHFTNSHNVYIHVHSSSQKNGDIFIPFCSVETEVKWPFPYTRMETGRAEADATEHYSNCSQDENDTSRAQESQKKHCSIQAIAFGGDQSRLATRGRLFLNCRLQTQSSLDHRTCSKSKRGSSKLLQNSLEDHGSIKLLILIGE